LSERPAPQRALIGAVVGPFGLRGEVKIAAADAGDWRLGLTLEARLPRGDTLSVTVAGVRAHQRRLLVRFEGVTDANAAGALRGARLFARVDDLPALAPNTYRDVDLIGMHVTDARLGALGDVSGVMHYPHADMLVVGERALLVPMLAAYGVRVDLATSSIETVLPDGFEDLA